MGEESGSKRRHHREVIQANAESFHSTARSVSSKATAASRHFMHRPANRLNIDWRLIRPAYIAVASLMQSIQIATHIVLRSALMNQQDIAHQI